MRLLCPTGRHLQLLVRQLLLAQDHRCSRGESGPNEQTAPVAPLFVRSDCSPHAVPSNSLLCLLRTSKPSCTNNVTWANPGLEWSCFALKQNEMSQKTVGGGETRSGRGGSAVPVGLFRAIEQRLGLHRTHAFIRSLA